jgi:hypothetical protein
MATLEGNLNHDDDTVGASDPRSTEYARNWTGTP